jgi:hypothetical protein
VSEKLQYWADCIGEAAEECGLKITKEQLDCLASAVEIGHEYMGMAFYSPPASDRISVIESEASDNMKRLQAEFDAYQRNAETAIKRALNQSDDAQVGIGQNGEVLRYGGRIERIQ